MVCYEYLKSVKSIGKLYILMSIIGVPLTLYFTLNSELFFALIAKYILLVMFAILFIVGFIYIFLKGEWFIRIDDSYFEYISPFGKTKCFKVSVAEIRKLEIQQTGDVESEHYYLYLKNNKKYHLDTESLMKMSKIEKCLKKLSVEIVYTADI